MLDVMDRVSRVAALDRPVLVVGERGTGKEMIGSRIHYLSKRWDRAFIKLNCAALPETLLESELFGYEPGAFTGATKRRSGRFEAADTGSLFLDEIANMSASAQEKLLRVVEYGEFERVGGSEAVHVDVRVVAAANEDLPQLADEGRFRHDLLDRLAFDVITLPPLRVRKDDIAELVKFFASGMVRDLDWDAGPKFDASAMDALRDYDWPGNVRELKNVVERAVYNCSGPQDTITEVVFDPFDSPWRLANSGTSSKDGAGERPEKSKGDAGRRMTISAERPIRYKETVAAIEKHLLSEALSTNKYKQSATARHLGLTYDQLRHALKKHGLLESLQR